MPGLFRIRRDLGLIGTIAAGALRHRLTWAPVLVGLYITAAYWVTASTSFANPAVTIARSLSTSFVGIALHSAPGFLAAQFAGTFVGFLFLTACLCARSRSTA